MATYYIRIVPCKKKDQKLLERADKELKRVLKAKHPQKRVEA